MCASEQEVLGAFLIHSWEKTRSLLSKWSTLSFSHLPFHLNSLFIRSHPLFSKTRLIRKATRQFISSLPWENLLCRLWDLFYFSGVCWRVKLQLEEREDKATREIHGWQVTQTVPPMTFSHPDNGEISGGSCCCDIQLCNALTSVRLPDLTYCNWEQDTTFLIAGASR